MSLYYYYYTALWIALAIGLFFAGIAKAMHYPLTNHRLSLALAATPLLLSLVSVIRAVESAYGINDDASNLLFLFLVFVQALVYGITELNRLRRKSSIGRYVDNNFSNIYLRRDFGIGRQELIYLLDAIGFSTERDGKEADVFARKGDDGTSFSTGEEQTTSRGQPPTVNDVRPARRGEYRAGGEVEKDEEGSLGRDQQVQKNAEPADD